MPEPIRTQSAGALRSPESFRLTIGTQEITLAASDERGRLYGLGALAGLVEVAQAQAARSSDRNPSPVLPTGQIDDQPALADRGYMLDVSRNRIPRRSTLLLLLDQLAALRYNHLELYFEHAFAYRGHEQVWRENGALTADDILWLDRECIARGIELVPNQNSFGHMAGWLKHDAYRDLAIAPDGFIDPWGNRRDYPFSLNPRAPRVKPFLSGLYDQLLPLFTSRRFNVGLDETFDLGQGHSTAAVDAIAAELLAADTGIDRATARHRAIGTLYWEMVHTVHQLVSERGRRTYLWADIVQNHPQLIAQLPKGVTAIEWGYEADHRFDQSCARLAEAGVAFLAAPGTASWNSPSGRLHTAERNIAAAVHAAVSCGGDGILLTDWGDNDHLAPIVVSLPAIVHAASLAWNPTGPIDRAKVFAYLDGPAAFDHAPHGAAALEALSTLEDDPAAPIVFNGSLLGAALPAFSVPAYARYLDRDYLQGEAAAILTVIEQRLDALESLPVRSVAHAGRSSLWQDGLASARALARYALTLLQARAVSDDDPARRSPAGHVEHYRVLAEREVSAEWQTHYQAGGLSAAVRRISAAATAAGIGKEHDS